MKKYKKPVIFCIVATIPVIIHIFQKNPDAAIGSKLLSIAISTLALFLGTGMVAALGGLIMYLAGRFAMWLFDETDKEPDLVSIMYALWPVLFAIAYYELLAGKALGVF